MGFWSCKVAQQKLKQSNSKITMFNDPLYRNVYISRPYGKWVSYKPNGEEENPEGIYKGDSKKWNKLVKEYKIEDFIDN